MLDPGTLQLLGEISVVTGQCEAALQTLAYELDGDDFDEARRRIGTPPVSRLVDTIGELLARSDLPPSLADDIRRRTSEVRGALETNRNQVLHGAWLAAGLQRRGKGPERYRQYVTDENLTNSLERLRNAGRGR